MAGNLFIRRPKFAIVISLVIVLAGLIVMLGLPLEDYPSITPPQVNVTATYTGASSDVIRDTIAAPLEAQLNGVEDMVYMTSTSKNGSYSLDVYFEVGSDPDMAVINVNNKLQLVLPRLPAEVRTYGLTVKKKRGGPGLPYRPERVTAEASAPLSSTMILHFCLTISKEETPSANAEKSPLLKILSIPIREST